MRKPWLRSIPGSWLKARWRGVACSAWRLVAVLGPLHALAGARVTVVDLSPKQLEHDQTAADELGLPIERIVTSMDDLSTLSNDSFDAVIHPVSLCYVRTLGPVYHEIARVLRSGGL